MKLFSQRNASLLERYCYEIPEQVRLRILHTVQQLENSQFDFRFSTLLDEIYEALCARLGGVYESGYRAARAHENPVLNHFLSVEENAVLDFLELTFRTRSMRDPDLANVAVNAINRIFEEHGLGYELTEMQIINTGKTGTLHGRPMGVIMDTKYPQILVKDEQTVHQQAVKPALEVLADSQFANANKELLDAFEEVRKGDYSDAITSCGSAFESVLKTICTAKGWAYDPKKDTCSALVQICQKNGLFPSFYTETFKGVGSIRNNAGDAHGKGPSLTMALSRILCQRDFPWFAFSEASFAAFVPRT